MRPRYETNARAWLRTAALSTCVLALAAAPLAAQEHQEHEDPDPDPTPSAEDQLQAVGDKFEQKVLLFPGQGYLEAHRDVRNPPMRLGGPLKVWASQSTGPIHVILPGPRELDDDPFGQPGLERAWGGQPLMYGLPPAMRETENGEYTETTVNTAFSNKHTPMRGGSFSLEALDQTLTDAAVTSDDATFRAEWKDGQGNTYAATCCDKIPPNGTQYPVFGGVVTNHMMHGITRIGTPLEPTQFAYVAFWGMGDVWKNGRVIDENRLMHGMLTERVRTDDYDLAFDEEVQATGKHFHLIVPPVMPAKAVGTDASLYEHNPVNTGFTLPNGKQLPFWHVMFETPTLEAQNLDVGRQTYGPAADERLLGRAATR